MKSKEAKKVCIFIFMGLLGLSFTEYSFASEAGRGEEEKERESKEAAVVEFASLHEAAQAGNVAAVNRMLAAGADIDQLAGFFPVTPLMWAVGQSHVAMVKALIRAGADIDKRYIEFDTCDFDMTPLMLAVKIASRQREADGEIVRTLIFAGADPRGKKNSRGKSAWSIANDDMKKVITGALEEKKRRDAANRENKIRDALNRKLKADTEVLGLHICRDSAGLVMDYLGCRGNGQDAVAADDSATAALRAAALKGDMKAVNKILAMAVVDVNAGDKDGLTSLMLAAEQGHVAVVEALIRAGARVNEVDNYYDTALMIAARLGHAGMVEALIKAGAKVNKVNPLGLTALIIAVEEGHGAVVEVLIKAGADPRQKNSENKDAWKIADATMKNVITEALIEKETSQALKPKLKAKAEKKPGLLGRFKGTVFGGRSARAATEKPVREGAAREQQEEAVAVAQEEQKDTKETEEVAQVRQQLTRQQQEELDVMVAQRIAAQEKRQQEEADALLAREMQERGRAGADGDDRDNSAAAE
ncbi:MAG: ankyrin repeat domain-containing protein [Candidatus Dependentiae bacterium]|nr:ankyrin repeat domain-containing protein [Candidatus Dependentiae bacterium]